MDLYDVKARGIRSPLNSREISHLFRSGHLHRRVRCKPKGEASWQTIGELFPLLEYGIGSYSLPPDDSKTVGRRRHLALLTVVIVTGVYLYCTQSSRDSNDIKSAVQTFAHPVAEPVAVARSN